MNILHKNLFPVSQWRTTVLIREIGVFIVHIIKMICKQYFKHFWYGGIELYDNISDIDVLRKQENGNYYMDYVILLKVDPINFAENGIDVKVYSEKALESAYFDDVCLITDGDSTGSEDSASDSDSEEKPDFHITVTDDDSAESEDFDNIIS